MVNAGFLVAHTDIIGSGAEISRHHRCDGARCHRHLSYDDSLDRRSEHAEFRNEQRASTRDEEFSRSRDREDIWI